jgi:hypothetical protein
LFLILSTALRLSRPSRDSGPRKLFAALSPEDRLVLLAFAEPDPGEVRHLDTLTGALTFGR